MTPFTLLHPYLSSCLIILSVVMKQSNNLAARAKVLMQASVADSSHLSYSVGWRRWVNFAQQCGESHLPGTSEPLVWFDGCWVERMVALALKFCTFSFENLGLAASTVGNYLAGVRHFLQLKFLSTRFWTIRLSPCYGPVSIVRIVFEKPKAKASYPL